MQKGGRSSCDQSLLDIVGIVFRIRNSVDTLPEDGSEYRILVQQTLPQQDFSVHLHIDRSFALVGEKSDFLPDFHRSIRSCFGYVEFGVPYSPVGNGR